MYDLTKIHPDHRSVFESLTPDAYITQEVIDKLYLVYVELNSIPKKDWGKQEHEMTKDQKKRFKAKLKETQEKRNITVVE